MESPTSTPPSRRSNVSTLCLALEESNDDGEAGRVDSSPFPHKKRQLQYDHLPLRELILLSPTRRPRCLAVDTENIDPNLLPKRRGKSKGRSLAPNVSPVGCASPRKMRRQRGRTEMVSMADENDLCFYEEEVVKVRRRKKKMEDNSALPASKKILGSVPEAGSTVSRSPGMGTNVNCSQGVVEFVHELVMWKNMAKSTLWFGLGVLCFLSSCFSGSFTFNFVSAASHACLIALALAFFCDAFVQREEEQRRRRHKLKEEDFLGAIRLMLPIANAAIEVAQEVFSGDPLITIKVAPVLLFIAKYSHLITFKRLLATGFFVSFTVPRLLSSYSHLIQKQIERMKSRFLEAWFDCQHKRVVTLSCGTMIWNLLGLRARIVAGFLAVVILRYYYQHSGVEEKTSRAEVEGREQEMKDVQGMVVEEEEAIKKEA